MHWNIWRQYPCSWLSICTTTWQYQLGLVMVFRPFGPTYHSYMARISTNFIFLTALARWQVNPTYSSFSTHTPPGGAGCGAT
jgi:hypothetical protein